MRLSLGATRARLVRQLLTESLLLAFVGGALGIADRLLGQAAAAAAGQSGGAARLARARRSCSASPPLTGIVFGIAPALRATGVNVSDALKQTGRSVAGSRSALEQVAARRAGRDLAGAAGRRRAVPAHAAQPAPGRRRLQSAEPAALPHQSAAEPLRREAADRAVHPAARAHRRGARRARRWRCRTRRCCRAASTAPASSSRAASTSRASATGQLHQPAGRLAQLLRDDGDPVLLGRGFTPRDNETAPKVVVINEAAAKKYFPNENPVGQRFGSSVENDRPARDRRRAARREVQQRARSGAADDVRAVPADARGQRR